MKGIEIKGISKTFKDTKALADVNLQLEEGKIYGLLGRNGAGKSTLLNIINNRIFQDEGTVTLDGEPVKENEQVLSRFFLVNENNLYPEGMKPSSGAKNFILISIWNMQISCAKYSSYLKKGKSKTYLPAISLYLRTSWLFSSMFHMYF